jgi:hypothetical protein
MQQKEFLDNINYGKNNWWRYALTSLASWLGPLILILIIMIIMMVIHITLFSNPFKQGTSPQESFENLNPMVLLSFFGIYYTLSFVLFYFCSRFIHHKKLILFINTFTKVRWMKILKGAGLWFGLMGCALLIELIIDPTLVEFSFNPSFFILLILSLVIYCIQASFEELFFRGYLMQGIGMITRKPVIPLLITSALFAIGHFFNGSNVFSGVGVVINMFIFGLTLGIITLAENSLETAMGVHIANNIFVTIVINNTGVFEKLPSLLTVGADSSLMIPSVILLPILLFFVLRKNWGKLKILSKKRYKSEETRISNQLLCLNCETMNPDFSNFCMECGEKIYAKYASTGEKTLAFLIDSLFLLFLSVILLIPIIAINLINPGVSADLLALVWILLDIVLFFLYFMFLDRKGQTIGKILMKIQVVNESNYKKIKYKQSFMRNLLLLVDLIPYPLPGILAVIFSAKTPTKQRIGDMAAGTIVIKK